MPTAPEPRFKLIFFVPPTHLAACKSAIFSTGAGRYPGPDGTVASALYVDVSVDTAVTGHFTPTAEASPHTGEPGKAEVTREVKCEILCVGESVVRRAVGELRKVHPYEVAVYEVYRMEEF